MSVLMFERDSRETTGNEGERERERERSPSRLKLPCIVITFIVIDLKQYLVSSFK